MKKFAIGDWYHLFGPGNKETRCRIVIDLEQSKLVAAQEWTGLKFEDVLGDRLKNLAESVIEVNQAHAKVDEWAPDPEFSDVPPPWVDPRSVSTGMQFCVLGAHANRNFFTIKVDAENDLCAFGAAALLLKEAGEDGDAEFYAAFPADVALGLPGDGVVTLDTVLDPEQAEVFGLDRLSQK
jgi:hypothetical protein